MNSKTNDHLIILLLLSPVLGIVIILLSLFIPSRLRDPIYYLPQVDTYVRVISSRSDSTIYVVINKGSIPVMTDSSDYVRRGRMTSCSDITLYFNPESDDVLVNGWREEVELHLTHFNGHIINDSMPEYYRSDVPATVFKYPYPSFSLYSDYMIATISSGEGKPGNKLKPIRRYLFY